MSVFVHILDVAAPPICRPDGSKSVAGAEVSSYGSRKASSFGGPSFKETRVVAVQEAPRRHGPVQHGAAHACIGVLSPSRAREEFCLSGLYNEANRPAHLCRIRQVGRWQVTGSRRLDHKEHPGNFTSMVAFGQFRAELQRILVCKL